MKRSLEPSTPSPSGDEPLGSLGLSLHLRGGMGAPGKGGQSYRGA